MTDLVPAGDGDVVDAELVDANGDDMGELVEQWITGRASRSVHTERAYRRDCASWLSWCALHSVDPLHARLSDGDRWIADLAARPGKRTGRPPAKASQARTISAVSSLYDFLFNRGYVDASPIRTDGRPQGSKRSTTVGLSAEETVKLRVQAREGGPRDNAVIDVMVVQGLRVAELADLNVRSYSWNKGRRTLIVVGKGDKRRELVVSPDVRAAIDNHLQVLAKKLDLQTVDDLDPAMPMFPSIAGGRLSEQAVMRTVQRLAKQARIAAWSKLSPHSLRHTCATNMLDAGVPINVVQDQLGHEDITTTLRYDRARGSLDRSGTGSYEDYLRDVERNMAAAA